MTFVKIDLDKKPEPEPKWAHIEEKKQEFPADLEKWMKLYKEEQPTSEKSGNTALWATLKLSQASGELSEQAVRILTNRTVNTSDMFEQMARMMFYMEILSETSCGKSLIDILNETEFMVDCYDATARLKLR